MSENAKRINRICRNVMVETEQNPFEILKKDYLNSYKMNLLATADILFSFIICCNCYCRIFRLLWYSRSFFEDSLSNDVLQYIIFLLLFHCAILKIVNFFSKIRHWYDLLPSISIFLNYWLLHNAYPLFLEILHFSKSN